MTAIPSAWLGQAAAFAPERVARVCCRCPDRAAAERIARLLDMPCTHSLCAECFKAYMAEAAAYEISLHSECETMQPAITAGQVARA